MASLNLKLFCCRTGQSLVELLLGMALISLVIPALLSGLVAGREGGQQQVSRLTATALMDQALEVVRSVRSAGWVAFAVNGLYHPAADGTSWSLATGAQSVDGYTRVISISDTQRNSSGAIVASGGTPDPSTKTVTVTVSWSTPFPSSVSTTAYFTRYMDNLTFTHTTYDDFLGGIFSGTAVVNDMGGEVALGAGGSGDWCAPDLTIASLDLPKNGVANALTAIPGQAFVGTGDNASGVSFADIRVDNNHPPAATIHGTIDGYKTNDVFGEAGYVYIAADLPAPEIVIIDLSVSPNAEVGYFNAPANGNGSAVAVSGNTGYMITANMLYNFDLSVKTGERPLRDSNGVSLAGTGTQMMIVGDYAYVSLTGTGTKLQIVDVSDPLNLTVVGYLDINSAGATDVFINSTGTRAYLVTGSSASQPEMFIIDTSVKTGSRPVISSYDSNGMSAKGVIVVPGNRLIMIGTGAEEYQVVNIALEGSPVYCGGLNIDTGVNGVAGGLEPDGDASSYIITGDASTEFKIIEGGPGGSYATDGTYISPVFDSGFQTAFNRLEFNRSVPNQTTLTLQVAVADAVSGSCDSADYQYLGPDGTSNTFYSAAGAIPVHDDGVGYENPGRCFRYKAYLASLDSTATPALLDITVNYSP